MAIITKAQLEQASVDANLLNLFRRGTSEQTIPTDEGLKPTIAGIVKQALVGASIDTLNGYSFTTGATIIFNNQALLDEDSEIYYRWSGLIPTGGIVVAANSTPAASGGIGPGKWLATGDGAIRSQLSDPDQMGSVIAMRLQTSWGKERSLTDKLSDSVNLRDIVGVDVTGSVNSASYLQTAFNSFGIKGGCIVMAAGDKIRLDDNLLIPQNCAFIGPLHNPEQARTTVAQSYYDYGGQIKLKPTATITLDRGSVIDKFLIINSDLTLPVTNNTQAATVKSQFSGTALSTVEPGNTFSNLLVLGFEWAFKGIATQPTSGRTNFYNFHFDCTNGIHKEYSVDIDRFNFCHGWPFLTAHITGVSDANLSRSGDAFYLKNVADWTQLVSCFAYGYNNGIVYDGVWNCQFIGGGLDLCGTTGFTVINGARFNRMTNTFINSKGFAGSINVTGSTNPDFKTQNCILNGQTNGVYVTAGAYDSVSDTHMGASGPVFTDGTVRGSVTDPLFDGCAVPITLTALSSEVVTIRGFKFATNQPNTTVAEKSFATQSIYYDRRAVATDIGHFFEQGCIGNDGKYRGQFRTGARLKNATVGSEKSDYTFTAYNLGTWADRFVMEGDGVFRPVADGTQLLGNPSHRWGQIYSGSGTINTSDRNYKTDETAISESEKATAIQIKGLLKSFRYKQAVDSKGKDARIHFGVIAQDVQKAFKDNGLNPDDYGLFCYDTWEETKEVTNDEGQVTTPYRAAGEAYGIRYEELLCFIMASI